MQDATPAGYAGSIIDRLIEWFESLAPDLRDEIGRRTVFDTPDCVFTHWVSASAAGLVDALSDVPTDHPIEEAAHARLVAWCIDDFFESTAIRGEPERWRYGVASMRIQAEPGPANDSLRALEDSVSLRSMRWRRAEESWRQVRATWLTHDQLAIWAMGGGWYNREDDPDALDD